MQWCINVNKSQLRWRCRRGMQELDILLLRFLDEHFDQSSVELQDAFVLLLKQQDDVLWDWFTGQHVAEDANTRHIIHLVQ